MPSREEYRTRAEVGLVELVQPTEMTACEVAEALSSLDSALDAVVMRNADT